MLINQVMPIIVSFLTLAIMSTFSLGLLQAKDNKLVKTNDPDPDDKHPEQTLMDRINSLEVSSIKLAKYAERCVEAAPIGVYHGKDLKYTFPEDYMFGSTFRTRCQLLKAHSFTVDFDRVCALEDEFFWHYKRLCTLRITGNIHYGSQAVPPVLIGLHETKERMENYLLSLNQADYSDAADEFLLKVVKGDGLTFCGA